MSCQWIIVYLSAEACKNALYMLLQAGSGQYRHRIGTGSCFTGTYPAASMFSMKIPYPRKGSFTRTCMMAPMSYQFCTTSGLALTVDVRKGQQKFTFFHYHF